ncbi:MAG TPA: hypothetical protein VG944_04905, partial [Fimbriimonas sp.]|nr:hypothetical protein [Fimbriimonas sp.]
MRLPKTIAAVIFAPMYASDESSTYRALDLMLKLGISHVVLVYDRLSQNGEKIATNVRLNFRSKFDLADGKLLIELSSQPDTGADWRAGIVRAFDTWKPSGVLVFPGDLDSRTHNSADLQRGLTRMLACSSPDNLILGDYTSAYESGATERFKTQFDAMSLPTIRALFPELFDLLMAKTVSKRRTEFFIVGSRIWAKFDRDRRFYVAAADLTFQLQRFMLEQPGSNPSLNIKKVHLGTLHDDDSRRNPLGQWMQLTRLHFTAALDRLNHEYQRSSEAGDSDADLLARYLRLCYDFEVSVQELTCALQLNAKALSDGSVTNPKLLSTRWFAPFPGFSVLFDQPGLKPYFGKSKVIDTTCADVPFYTALEQAMAGLLPRLSDKGFAILPRASWHVTAADMAGIYSLDRSPIELRDWFKRWLQNIPWSKWKGFPPVRPFTGHPVEFRFKELKVFSRPMALVAKLEPVGKASEDALVALADYRSTLDKQWKDWKDSSSGFTPHVSLGYWIN